MDSKDSKKNHLLLGVDYFQLMDLRIDFAFKLLFTKGNPRLLISLLNSLFEGGGAERRRKNESWGREDKDSDSLIFRQALL